jgi:predicted RNA binding protein YcfA (HicA-like mRNA interferase family)/predicted RNase H-like HicB family nuclease
MNRLRREGWTERPGKGSHIVLRKPGHVVVVPDHRGDIKPGTLRSICRGSRLGISAATVKDTGVKNYVAVVEASDDGTTLWISFPGLPGVTSAADRPEAVVRQAQDALASAIEAGVLPPPAIEDGMSPPADLSGYHNPLVVLVPYEAPAMVT